VVLRGILGGKSCILYSEKSRGSELGRATMGFSHSVGARKSDRGILAPCTSGLSTRRVLHVSRFYCKKLGVGDGII